MAASFILGLVVLLTINFIVGSASDFSGFIDLMESDQLTFTVLCVAFLFLGEMLPMWMWAVGMNAYGRIN